MSRLPDLEDDNLVTPSVGEWAERKYLHVTYYASLFATSMKGKWDYRVYIDLFAGSGRSKIEDSNRIVEGFPMLALGVHDSFDRYVFCESDERRLSALQQRADRDYPDRDVRFVGGDVNRQVEAILGEMPRYGSDQTVLGFCFADPYKMRDLHFETLRRLARYYIDFLVLIPTGMDAARAWKSYLRDENETVDMFLGTDTWREEWKKEERKGASVDGFLTGYYHRQMREMGYVHGGIDDTVLIRLPGKNVPLYRLGFFSRNPLGVSFWRQVRKYGSPQTDLFRR